MPRQLMFGAALLLLLAVSAQASRWSLETDEQGRHLLQAAKSPNCTRINKHCAVCRNQRIPGTRRSELVCSQCEAGYRLRRDGTSKICDCAPGLAMDENGDCQTCTEGKFCPGGDAANPTSDSSDCPAGLATTFAGAKSQAQCFTVAGHGRVSTKGSDGKVTLSAVVCEVGTYNVGSNTAGCQKCGAGLTTATDTSTSAADCVAPAGSYMDKGIGKLCQRGTYSTDLNSNNTCTPCPDGITTANEGSDSADDCSLAMKGYYINASDPTQAIKCPVDTYQDNEIATTSCTACPNGWKTKETGATGVALCLAPPGYELKDGATTITACDAGSYKADWNRNLCVACGTGLITKETGSVSKDACLVPAGWGLIRLTPDMEAAPCSKNTYGHNVDRVAVANARCTACPVNTYTADHLEGDRALNTNESYTSEAACLVKPGWGTTATIPQECPVGTYNAGNNRLPCQHCDTGLTTLDVGKTSAAACVIQPGWQMAADGIPAPCDKGTYSTGGTEEAPNATCTACLTAYSTQEDEATSADDCAVCAPGYGGDNGACVKCPAGKYSFGGGAVTVACEDCAAGSTSAEGSTHPQQCYSTLIDARNDVFNLANEASWVAEAAEVDTAAECGDACTGLATCVMFKFDIVNAGTGAGNCSLFNAAGTPTHFAGFKISNGADYSRWGVDQSIGAALDPQPAAAASAADEAACLAACTASAECEVYMYDITGGAGSCTLTKSELEQAAISMFQVRGGNLYSYTSA